MLRCPLLSGAVSRVLQGAFCGLLLLGATPTSAEEPEKKLDIPTEAAQTAALKTVKEVYEDQWEAAKTSTQKQAFAKALMQTGVETKKDAAARFVLFKIARDIAAQVADDETAFQAIDAMGQSFQIEALEMKSTVLAKLASMPRPPEEHAPVAEKALALLEEAVAKDDFRVASHCAETALAEARKAKDKAMVARTSQRAKQIEEIARTFENVKRAATTLEKTPTDPDANLAVGKYKCFVHDDWAAGLAMLALGSDGTLKALAAKELQPPSAADEQAALGDAWWDLAEDQEGAEKSPIRKRAAFWYEKALPGLGGLLKDRVEKRLASVSEQGVEKPVAVASRPAAESRAPSPRRPLAVAKTSLIGGGGGGKFEDVQPTAKIVGFVVTTKRFAGHVVIGAVQVLFSASRRVYPSQIHGHPGNKPVLIQAKPGYAVGAIVGKGGQRLDGFKVVFMRDRKGQLDPKDSYESDWVGGQEGGDETILGGDGRPVVGIYGGCGAEFDGLGLVQLQ